jgi:hypothetical protein
MAPKPGLSYLTAHSSSCLTNHLNNLMQRLLCSAYVNNTHTTSKNKNPLQRSGIAQAGANQLQSSA